MDLTVPRPKAYAIDLGQVSTVSRWDNLTQIMTTHPTPKEALQVACSNCSLRELCMPVGLNPEELARVDELVASRRKVKRGSALFRRGEVFTSLFAIRTGFFKTCVATEDG